MFNAGDVSLVVGAQEMMTRLSSMIDDGASSYSRSSSSASSGIPRPTNNGSRTYPSSAESSASDDQSNDSSRSGMFRHHRLFPLVMEY